MRSGFLTSNNHWLINAKMRQVEIYRPNREVKILEYPKSLSGEDVLPGFVLDLQPIFERRYVSSPKNNIILMVKATVIDTGIKKGELSRNYIGFRLWIIRRLTI